MSQMQMPEDPTEQIFLVLLVGLGLGAVPAFIPQLRHTIVTWLLEHHIVMPDSHALFSIPTTGVGLDARRVVALVGLLLLLTLLGRRAACEHRDENERKVAS